MEQRWKRIFFIESINLLLIYILETDSELNFVSKCVFKGLYNKIKKIMKIKFIGKKKRLKKQAFFFYLKNNRRCTQTWWQQLQFFLSKFSFISEINFFLRHTFFFIKTPFFMKIQRNL